MSGTDRAHELGAFLAGIPFFASFDTGTLVWLARQFEPVHAQAGDAIIAEGDPGDGLYVLLSGRLRVTVGERVLHDLGRGAVVGEIALLSDRMRSATVRAVRDSDLLLLRTASFKALIEQNPGFLAQMARLLIERLLAVDRPQPDAGNRAIAVAPAGRDPAHAKAIAAAMTDRLTGSGATILLDRDAIDRQLGRWRTTTTSATDTRRTSPGSRAWSRARRAAWCSAAAARAVSRTSACCTPSSWPACPSTSSAGPASAR